MSQQQLHSDEEVCMCDIDEVKVNQLFLKYLTEHPIFSKVEISYDLQGEDQMGAGFTFNDPHYEESCLITRNMNGIFPALVERLEDYLNEKDSVVMSKIHMEKRVDGGEHDWRFWFAYASSN